MDLVKIFKYIIGINVLIVFLFFVFVLIVNFSQKKSEEKPVISDNNSSSYQDKGQDDEVSSNKEFSGGSKQAEGENKDLLQTVKENQVFMNEFFLKTEEIDNCYRYKEEYLRNSCEKIALFKLVIESESSDVCKISKNKLIEEECEIYYEYIQFLKKESFEECVDYTTEKDEILCKQSIFSIYQYLTKTN